MISSAEFKHGSFTHQPLLLSFVYIIMNIRLAVIINLTNIKTGTFVECIQWLVLRDTLRILADTDIFIFIYVMANKY